MCDIDSSVVTGRPYQCKMSITEEIVCVYVCVCVVGVVGEGYYGNSVYFLLNFYVNLYLPINQKREREKRKKTISKHVCLLGAN